MISYKEQYGTKKLKYTCGSLFSGIGGFCEGFEDAGFSTSWATDFDQQVAETYALNFPETKFFHEKIEDLNFSSLSAVDVVHAGFPCQSFSQAGDRKGFNDPRGNLFNVMMDKFEESSWLPSVLVFENSPYLMSGDQGMWFEHVKERINKLGYWFTNTNAIIIDANKHCGSPQRRERLFMFACNKQHFEFNWFNFSPATVSLKSINEYLETNKEQDAAYYLSESNKYGKMLSEAAKKLPQNQLLQLRKYYFREIEYGTCPTLTANMGLGGHNVPFLMDDYGLRKLTERECLNLQGFSRNFKFPAKFPRAAKYRMVGNAVSPEVSKLVAREVISVLEDRFDDFDLAV